MAITAFRDQVTRLWFKSVRRRSQKTRINWTRMHRIATRWLPRPRNTHPYPSVRFAAMHQGRSLLAGRAARPDLAAAVACQRRRRRRRAVGGRPGTVAAAPRLYSASRLELMISSLLVLVGADVIRPSLAWLLTGGKKRELARNMICSRDPGGFELCQFCRDDPAITPAARAKVAFRCAVIIAAKGAALADITIGDVLEVLDAPGGTRARPRGTAEAIPPQPGPVPPARRR